MPSLLDEQRPREQNGEPKLVAFYKTGGGCFVVKIKKNKKNSVEKADRSCLNSREKLSGENGLVTSFENSSSSAFQISLGYKHVQGYKHQL